MRKFVFFIIMMIYSVFSYSLERNGENIDVDLMAKNITKFWLMGCNSSQVAIDKISRGEDEDKTLSSEYGRVKNDIYGALNSRNDSKDYKGFLEGLALKYSFDGFKFKYHNKNKNCDSSSKMVYARVNMALRGDKESQESLKGFEYAK
ncbi:hypothetical protein CUU54_02675 [Pectobacterium polaris]|uniref:hypothetical protein n=1 Tax=Pectobacterium polaris TaxID=2042057 RepID=UPI0011B23F78|nr:hypothetical protein [Pectobacterium polaris]MCU1787762.1 hypothetical protein [Pectobacterium polaris]